MAILGRFTKQPVDELDYEFDFTAWLADRNDVIAGVPTVVATTLGNGTGTLTISDITTSQGIVRFIAKGGNTGTKYEVACTITTASTPRRVKQDELIITVKET